MSRSIGDHGMGRDLVISTPTITERELTESDACFILASDGVFEFISSQRAVDIVHEHSKEGATVACQKLIDAAMEEWRVNEGGSYRDDITAIVVFLPAFPAIDAWWEKGGKRRIEPDGTKNEKRRNSVVMQADIEHQLEEMMTHTGGDKKDRLSIHYGTDPDKIEGSDFSSSRRAELQEAMDGGNLESSFNSGAKKHRSRSLRGPIAD